MLHDLIEKIRKANRHKLRQETAPQDSDVYNIPDMDLKLLFKQELEKVGGRAFICQNRQDLIEKLKNFFNQKSYKTPVTFSREIKQILQQAEIKFYDDDEHFKHLDAGLNTCEALVAWTGSVVVSSKQAGSRQINVYAPELIIIAHSSQLFLNIDQALDYVLKKYNFDLSLLSLITGPSKTADIEKTLIYGMHGARQVYVFIYD